MPPCGYSSAAMSRAARRPPPRPPAPAPSVRRSRAARSLRALAVLALLIVAVVVWQAVATRGWQPAQATVGEIETQVAPAVDLRRLHLRWGRRRREAYTYRYQVGAASYEGREEGAAEELRGETAEQARGHSLMSSRESESRAPGTSA